MSWKKDTEHESKILLNTFCVNAMGTFKGSQLRFGESLAESAAPFVAAGCYDS